MKSFCANILFIFVLVIQHIGILPAAACTTAIISGKQTQDGRPLLLKQRDSDKLENKLMYFSDGKYKYVGLVNAADTLGKEVWAGANSRGFAIMNSASYNLKGTDTTSLKDREGVIMKLALQSCATIEDFERLLRDLPRPLGVEANFGVIDARGGAAYYETNNFDFVKFDANDPKIAPDGYIIRTNYSYTGDAKKGYGIIRYQTASQLFEQAAMCGRLSYKFLLKEVSRSLKQTLTETDLYKKMPLDSAHIKMVPFRDFIPRYSTAAAIVIQGVKKSEPASLTTIWTVLGFPLSSVVVPVWVAGGRALPNILVADQSERAPLCRMALQLKKRLFPFKRGSGNGYLNLSALLNKEGNGILQLLDPVEERVIEVTEENLTKWRSEGIIEKETQAFYRWVDGFIRKSYQSLFKI